MRKTITGLAFMLALCIFASTAFAATPTDQPVTIKIANYALLESGYTEFWETAKASFEQKYPNVTIEWITAPYGEMVNQVINMAGGGDVVDAVFSELIWVPTFADAGLAAPIESCFDEVFLSDFYPNVLASHQIDGITYALPLYVSSVIIYYNKDILQAAGIESAPSTYDELLACAEKISGMTTEDGNKIYPFGIPTASVPVVGSFLTSMAYNFGGTLLDDKGNLTLNDAFTDSFRMLQTLDSKGYIPQNCKPKDLRNLFALGQLAMYYDQSWGLNGILSINPDAKDFTTSTLPLSGGEGTGAGTLQSHCFVMIDNGNDRAWATSEFIKYLISPEVLDNYMTNITPAFPAKHEMDACIPEILKPSAQATEQAIPVPLIARLNDFNLELCALAQQVTVGGVDVEKAITSFVVNAESILDK